MRWQHPAGAAAAPLSLSPGLLHGHASDALWQLLHAGLAGQLLPLLLVALQPQNRPIESEKRAAAEQRCGGKASKNPSCSQGSPGVGPRGARPPASRSSGHSGGCRAAPGSRAAPAGGSAQTASPLQQRREHRGGIPRKIRNRRCTDPQKHCEHCQCVAALAPKAPTLPHPTPRAGASWQSRLGQTAHARLWWRRGPPLAAAPAASPCGTARQGSGMGLTAAGEH